MLFFGWKREIAASKCGAGGGAVGRFVRKSVFIYVYLCMNKIESFTILRISKKSNSDIATRFDDLLHQLDHLREPNF